MTDDRYDDPFDDEGEVKGSKKTRPPTPELDRIDAELGIANDDLDRITAIRRQVAKARDDAFMECETTLETFYNANPDVMLRRSVLLDELLLVLRAAKDKGP